MTKNTRPSHPISTNRFHNPPPIFNLGPPNSTQVSGLNFNLPPPRMVHTQQGAPSIQAQSVTPSEIQIETQQPHHVTTQPQLYQVTPQTVLPEHSVDTNDFDFNDISEQVQQHPEVNMINQGLGNPSSGDNPEDLMGDQA